MADPRRKLSTNASGDFFVDMSCIDCDACRQFAPATFAQRGVASAVAVQPRNQAERAAALRALVACPVGAIGTQARHDVAPALAAFPIQLDGPVSLCGFNDRATYGANSYFLLQRDGNWLIDAPRYSPHLVRAFEQCGGISYIFLTHRDDVGDASAYAARFGSTRIIHRADRQAQPDAEVVLDGAEAIGFAPGFTIVPTPGHTRGHCVLLYDRFLFSGDHLAWDPERERLAAYRDVCWYDWPEQIRSVMKLAAYDFEWILPGHGRSVRLERAARRAAFADFERETMLGRR
jgi:glyoxylase-like metal-dependent hydrolase (beta-lactamase superfamily II)/ferredoxin